MVEHSTTDERPGTPADSLSKRMARQRDATPDATIITSKKTRKGLPPDTHFIPAPLQQPGYLEHEIFFEPVTPDPPPEEKTDHPWLAATLPRKAAPYLPIIALAIAALVFSAGAWAYFVGSGPSESAIEHRLNNGDAQGADYQYRVEIVIQPDPEAEAQALPDEDERWFLVNETLAHRQTRIVPFGGGGAGFSLREAVGNATGAEGRRLIVPAQGVQFDVQDHSGRTYSGEVTTDPPTPFRLKLDGLQRFELLTLDKGDLWIRVLFSYDGISFNALGDSQTQGPLTVDLQGAAVTTDPGEKVSVRLNGGNVLRPGDLEMRFVDANGSVVRSVGFDWTLDADGYYFRWRDTNKNGAVDQGDVITIKVPDQSLEPKVWDRWSGSYTEAGTKGNIPGPGLALGILGVGLAAWGHERRRSR